MGKAYSVNRYNLTAMQFACHTFLKTNKGPKTVDEIIKGVYSCYKKENPSPDIWTYEEKVIRVTKWCDTLAHLKLIEKLPENKYTYK